MSYRPDSERIEPASLRGGECLAERERVSERRAAGRPVGYRRVRGRRGGAGRISSSNGSNGSSNDSDDGGGSGGGGGGDGIGAIEGNAPGQPWHELNLAMRK